ncbi:hypothetical protein I7I48_06645 [Histoplasma ohiense]|nr:hypothetical protein I7I48_06645 [Histoplasma ohiense (nom. inval.)]
MTSNSCYLCCESLTGNLLYTVSIEETVHGFPRSMYCTVHRRRLLGISLADETAVSRSKSIGH